MQVGSKYEFPTYNSTPNFWAKVNGNYATVEKTYGKDPAKYVTVEYEFGECNDSIIENIIMDSIHKTTKRVLNGGKNGSL